MNSILSESTEMPHFPKLEGSVKTDVLMIGEWKFTEIVLEG